MPVFHTGSDFARGCTRHAARPMIRGSVCYSLYYFWMDGMGFCFRLISGGLRSLAVSCLASFVVASPAFAAADSSPVRIAMIEGMSGPFANAGAAVERNLRFGVERVNASGGAVLPDGKHPLQLVVLDGKGSSEASLIQLRAAID